MGVTEVTKWVLTAKTGDGHTVHLEDPDPERIKAVIRNVEIMHGKQDYTLEEHPALWECDGSDGCHE